MDETSTRTLPMLTILVATCETTLNTLKAADNPVDKQLTELLEKMVDRTYSEIRRLKAGS